MRGSFPVVGIMGGGQLGRMLALAGIRMGLQIRFLSPTPEGSMRGLGEATIADWKDPRVLTAWAEGCDVVTVESEWAPADILEPVLPAGTVLWPAPDTLRIVRDKGLQKSTLAARGIPVPHFELVDTQEAALAAAAAFGFPCLLKRRQGSYDGYGNATVRSESELKEAWEKLGGGGIMVEAWAPFIRELAVLVVRRPGGEHVVYPVLETEQRDHRCHSVIAPARISDAVAGEACRVALQAVEAIGGVGNIAVELFEMADGSVQVNEMAPRPHNTGHFSIEGCFTSQFENHLRAVLDWPLGSPDLRTPAAVMVNVLGSHSGPPGAGALEQALQFPCVSIHIYGKEEARPRRKMGHVTITGENPNELLQRAEAAAASIIL